MSSDPKLVQAMKEVRAVLKKHDIAAWVTLYSATHSEFGMEVTPSWSCAYWEDKEQGKLRFRAKQKEIGREKAHALITATCHMIFSMRDLCAKGFQYADNMAKLLQTQVQVDHKPLSNVTTHSERAQVDGFRPIEET